METTDSASQQRRYLVMETGATGCCDAESAVPSLPAVVAGCKQKHPVSMKTSGVYMRGQHPASTSVDKIRRQQPVRRQGRGSAKVAAASCWGGHDVTSPACLPAYPVANEQTKTTYWRRLMGADVASIDLTGLLDDDEDDAFDAYRLALVSSQFAIGGGETTPSPGTTTICISESTAPRLKHQRFRFRFHRAFVYLRTQYLRTLSQQKDADVVSGPHFRSHSSGGERTLYIGCSKMKIDDGGYIVVGKDNYEARPGLLELIFKKEPNLTVVQERDWNDYKKILRHSYAHREGYNRNGEIRIDNLWNHNHVFASLFPPPPSPAPPALRANTAMQRRATTRHRKKAGKGLRFVTPPDYEYLPTLTRVEGSRKQWTRWGNNRNRERTA
ncbi:Uncharacterized protein GBIM_19398 [Gryllus bimaculatus]|nr:Uncharacterized protein GBIM_19398 [Gryllus bimaculatus]